MASGSGRGLRAFEQADQGLCSSDIAREQHGWIIVARSGVPGPAAHIAPSDCSNAISMSVKTICGYMQKWGLIRPERANGERSYTFRGPRASSGRPMPSSPRVRRFRAVLRSLLASRQGQLTSTSASRRSRPRSCN